MSLSLLPDLERELIAAAERLEPQRVRRRRPWTRGWVLFSALLATTGVGVATAVTHFGPFSYLDGDGPLRSAAATLVLQPGGDDAAFRVVAQIERDGKLCMTGGPRDPRTNPAATPTEGDSNNPPATVRTCLDPDEAAQTLVDPAYPGATFAGNAPLDGSPDVNMFTEGPNGEMIPVSDDLPTRMLVYALAPRGLTPMVRWGTDGAPQKMQAAEHYLRFHVNKSPDGLSKADARLIATFPDSVDLVLWAADVAIPKGPLTFRAQVAFPAELPPHGVPDGTIELLTPDEMNRIIRAGRKTGWKYEPGISRGTPATTPADGEQAR
ncbi:MAG: hypothetical protein J7513_12895 [Solirubrobacteraceae bacterium]|nr:hypothetical protein [Solirubrobacteraceae bacterium]